MAWFWDRGECAYTWKTSSTASSCPGRSGRNREPDRMFVSPDTAAGERLGVQDWLGSTSRYTYVAIVQTR